jgi:hypothetical protein
VMYLLDSNVFITAKNSYYGFDFVPGFWGALHAGNAAQSVFSVRAVYDEMQALGDDLSRWVKLPASRSIFLAPDSSTIASISTISEWASGQSYTPSAQREFLSVADLPLIAHAHAHSDTVVTLEKSQPDSKKRILIPDVCNAFGVTCISPFVMLRQLGVVLS